MMQLARRPERMYRSVLAINSGLIEMNLIALIYSTIMFASMLFTIRLTF